MCNQKEVPKYEGEMEMINGYEVRVPMGIKIELRTNMEYIDSNWRAQVEKEMRLEALAKTFAR